jgi:Uma2 family endonuclease
MKDLILSKNNDMTAIIAEKRVKLPYAQTEMPRRISLSAFLKKYREGGNGYKYEFNNGVIEKTDAMKKNEIYILQNLLRVFKFTTAFAEDAALVSEVETWTSDTQFRKPDISYWTWEQQIDDAESMPLFAIEVISKNDPINVVNTKVLEYFKSGVKVLWHIFPEQRMVYVFTSPKHITVCFEDDICSAAPVLLDFEISVNGIFAKK